MIKSALLLFSVLILGGCADSKTASINNVTSITYTATQISEFVPINYLSTGDINVPESVTVSEDGIPYVSNLGGEALASLNKGFISRLTNGIWEKAFESLDDPKGMVFIRSNLALVSDHPKVKLIDFSTKQVLSSLTINNAAFLNDLARLSHNKFVVTDTGTGNVHQISLDNNNILTSKPIISAQQLGGNGVNGVIYSPQSRILYLATTSAGGDANQGHVWQVELDSNFDTINFPVRWSNEPIGNGRLDGLALSDDASMLFVSDWNHDDKVSKIFIFDIATQSQYAEIEGGFKSAADIALYQKYLYIPEFTEDSIVKVDLTSVL